MDHTQTRDKARKLFFSKEDRIDMKILTISKTKKDKIKAI